METMHEARYSEERGWYVVDPWGHMAHVPGADGALRAAFFDDDREAAEALAARLNERPE
jgi:hypothetical protein